MIQLLRVDHRLLHGQVVFSWCSQLNPNCILIANDAAATDDVRKAALRLGKPNNAKLVIKTVEDSIAAINEGKTDKYSLMIVTGNVKDAGDHPDQEHQSGRHKVYAGPPRTVSYGLCSGRRGEAAARGRCGGH